MATYSGTYYTSSKSSIITTSVPNTTNRSKPSSTPETKTFKLKQSTSYKLVTKMYFRTTMIWGSCGSSSTKSMVASAIISAGTDTIGTIKSNFVCSSKGYCSSATTGSISITEPVMQRKVAKALNDGTLTIKVKSGSGTWWRYPCKSYTYFGVDCANIGSSYIDTANAEIVVDESFFAEGATELKTNSLKFNTITSGLVTSSYKTAKVDTTIEIIGATNKSVFANKSFNQNFSTKIIYNTNLELTGQTGFVKDTKYNVEITSTITFYNSSGKGLYSGADTPGSDDKLVAKTTLVFGAPCIPLSFSPSGHIVKIGGKAGKTDDEVGKQRFLIDYPIHVQNCGIVSFDDEDYKRVGSSTTYHAKKGQIKFKKPFKSGTVPVIIGSICWPTATAGTDSNAGSTSGAYQNANFAFYAVTNEGFYIQAFSNSDSSGCWPKINWIAIGPAYGDAAT